MKFLPVWVVIFKVDSEKSAHGFIIAYGCADCMIGDQSPTLEDLLAHPFVHGDAGGNANIDGTGRAERFNIAHVVGEC